MKSGVQATTRSRKPVSEPEEGGPVVDYIGLSDQLKHALATYTESGGTGRTEIDKGEAIALMIEKYEICLAMLHGFDFSKWATGTAADRISLLPAAQEHILAQENGKDRFIRAVRNLSRAFALSAPCDEAMRIRTDVAFFQQVQTVLAKRAAAAARPEDELDEAERRHRLDGAGERASEPAASRKARPAKAWVSSGQAGGGNADGVGAGGGAVG